MLNVDHSKAPTIPRIVISSSGRKIARQIDLYIDVRGPDSVILSTSRFEVVRAAAEVVGIDLTTTRYRGAWLKCKEET